MRNAAVNFTIVVVALVVGLMSGCETQEASGTKKTRLIAAENMKLEKQLQAYEKKLQNQAQQLEKCQRQMRALQQRSQEDIQDIVGMGFQDFVQKNAALREENEKLKKQVEELTAKPAQKDKAAESGS